MTSSRHFDSSYREIVRLGDGLELELRTVRPSDKSALVAGLARMSPQSRYFRFFTNKSQFTPAELKYLTEVDGEDHFALVAMCTRDDGAKDGVGIARFVRLRGEPTVAEAAVAVVDEYQRRGIGRLLFLRLAAAASERGIRNIRSEVLAQNRAIRAIVQSLAPGAQEKRDGNVIAIDAPLQNVAPTVPPDEPSDRGANYKLFALVAEQAVELRHPTRGPRPGVERRPTDPIPGTGGSDEQAPEAK